MNRAVPKPFGLQDKIGYALGDLGCNLCFQLVASYMFLFYTQCIGLSTSDWAWIIIISKVWDAVNDIIIGRLVDSFQIGKKSKFKPWITIGAVGLVAFTIMIFVPIFQWSKFGKIAWCLASYCLWSVSYSFRNYSIGFGIDLEQELAAWDTALLEECIIKLETGETAVITDMGEGLKYAGEREEEGILAREQVGAMDLFLLRPSEQVHMPPSYYITDAKLFSVQQLLNEMNNNIMFMANNSGQLAGVDVTALPTATMRMAIAAVAIIPIMIAYPFFQKYFAKGIVMGAVKG